MAKELRCRDLGFDCDHVVRAENEEEVLQKAAAHAKENHGLNEVTPEVAAKARSVMKDA